MPDGSVTDETDMPGIGAAESPPPTAGGAPPGVGGGGGPGGPGGLGGAGGILAALARNRQGPQISAPGPGNQADSMNMLMQAIGLIQQAALGLMPGTPLHKDALNSAQRLSRHLGQGTMGPGAGIQKTMLGDMLRQTIQNMMLQRIQSQQGMAKPGAPQGPGGGPQQPAPMPATPLPGA